MRRVLSLLAASALLAAAVGIATANTDYGNGWVADPGQSFTYAAAVQSPINPDGSSNFKAKSGAVIPVKFALSQGSGPLIFESTAAHPYSNVVYTPTTPMTLSDITSLSANYAFTTGDCQAGSLRWEIGTPSGSVYVYFYNPNTPTSPVCTGANNRSGVNLLTLGGNTEALHLGAATQYDSWANVVAAYPNVSVNWLGVVVDAAPPDEIVTLNSATINGTNTFAPAPSSGLTTVCPSAPATFSVTKVDGSASVDVYEPLTIQPNDTNNLFRIVDCKYMYNLATSSLSGTGTYTVYATINGSKFTVGSFDLK